MNRGFLIAACILTVSFAGCQKQQSEEERRAEVEREVQQRLAAEHQQQQAQQLDQREAALKEREQSLTEKEQTSASSRSRETRETDRHARQEEGLATGQQAEGSYSIFYTKLEPYGDWIETRDYGYVYRPHEAENSHWRPYTNGRWAYTDGGWTWISDEPFGWATYHYGRWTRIRGVGWIWVPGDQWAPAWVSWRKGGEYVGWAPLPPEARFDHRRGIHNWSDNYYDIGPDQYVFVSAQQFGEERVERAIVPEQRNVAIVNQTTNVTNITYNNTIIVNQGPDYDELARQSKFPVPRLRIQRQTNVVSNEPRPVVRGDVVEIPAPMLAPTNAVQRPRIVKQKIAETAVDLGWGAINNSREAEQARAKIKSEATPPLDAPPKRAEIASTSTTPPPPVSAPTPAANVPARSATPEQMASPAQITATAPPAISATPTRNFATSPSAPRTTASPPQQQRTIPPVPSTSPTAQPTVPIAPDVSRDSAYRAPAPVERSPESSIAPSDQRKRFKSAARQFEHRATVPMSSPSSSLAPALSPGETPGPSPEHRQGGETGVAQPGTTASASPTPSNDSNPPGEVRRERKNRKQQAGANLGTASPLPSTTPSP